MEYNVSKETALVVGDKLSDDAGAKFIVRDLHRKNTYSQYPSLVLIECYEGYRKGQVRWVSHELAIQYKDK